VLDVQVWSGPRQSLLAREILRVQISGGAVPVIADVIAIVLVALIIVRAPRLRWIVVSAIGLVTGCVIAAIILIWLAASDALGITLTPAMSAWAVVGFAGIGLACASFFVSRTWRIPVAAGLLIMSVATATMGINSDFGLDPTVAALAGISTQKVITIPATKTTPSATPTVINGGPLWANWSAPKGMPTVGSEAQVVIPATISGFRARPAGLYLPPAALVRNPPALPLVIMMMGQPGNPDPAFQATALNAFAARHKGLAPIVLVADQIGNPVDDPLCTDDTRYGHAETYISEDVVNWARTHLHVLQDAAHWTIAGYSNGGECALSLGAQYPNIWGNVLDISGEAYPGSDKSVATLATVFHNDRAAYEATWPVNILPKHTYPDSVGIFTVSTNDPQYLPQAKEADAAATEAHWTTTFYEVPGGGHVLGALEGGLNEGYSVLYPRLGLTPPSIPG
jgi:enterochelin esterase-like enzyme